MGARLAPPQAEQSDPGNPRREVTVRTQEGALVLPQQLPVGWPPRWYGEIPKDAPGFGAEVAWHVAATVLGMLLMAASCMLGAPMWFQILASLLPLRAAGKVPPRVERPKQPDTTGAGMPVIPPAAPAPSGRVPAAPSGESLNALEQEMLEGGELTNVQKALKVTASGAFDAATRGAIRALQEEKGYAPTGQLTRLLLRDLKLS